MSTWPGPDRWRSTGIGVTALIFLVAALFGLVILPYAQPDLKFTPIWDAICSAAGVVRNAPAAETEPSPTPVSTVAMNSQLLGKATAESIGRGATIAHQCAICHGPTGISRADSPNLGGQYADAVYKQLVDFKTGARSNAIMTPFAVALSEEQMIDVANYYHFVPRLPLDQPVSPPKIVSEGAPMRNIAPCGSCHGSLDQKPGTPWLYEQPAAYVKAQLEAFASGARRNDISGQMRNIARRMTPEEIAAVAAYYGGPSAE